MEQIVGIINRSERCEQFINYECFYAYLLFDHYSWWVSRDGVKMTHWGGADFGSNSCACGMMNNCVGNKKCNCDSREKKWNEDSGYLKNKSTLPVSELRFGDTGGTLGSDMGYHTLGKLQCRG